VKVKFVVLLRNYLAAFSEDTAMLFADFFLPIGSCLGADRIASSFFVTIYMLLLKTKEIELRTLTVSTANLVSNDAGVLIKRSDG
jgi:hypothetical protein